jgi:hypothetical protein
MELPAPKLLHSLKSVLHKSWVMPPLPSNINSTSFLYKYIIFQYGVAKPWAELALKEVTYSGLSNC